MEKTDLYVIKIAECTECRGSRWVRNPQWDAYWHAHRQRFPQQEPTPDEDEAFLLEYWGGDPPPEEEPCVECEGRGSIEKRVPLEAALRELLPRLLTELGLLRGADKT